MNIFVTLPYILLPLSCLWFDEALKLSFIRKKDILRAAVDNVGHGVISSLSWLAVIGLKNAKGKRNISEVAACGIIASLIDVDHFIAAKSLKLKKALHLHQRPPLHSTSLLLLIVPCCTLIALYHPSLSMLPLIVTMSFISHLVRDGQRRGLWFWPLGSTPALPYWLYVVIIVTIPFILSLIVRRIKNKAAVTAINV